MKNAARALVLAIGLVFAAGSFATHPVLAYSPTAAASYADTWATACNPYHGICYLDDCTAFVSKALYWGGHYTMVGVGLDKTNYRYWWNKNDPIVGAWYNSNSWSLVKTHWSFEIYHSPGGSDWGTMPGSAGQYNSGVDVGDLIFYDWTSDGPLDHVAIQVGRGTDPNKGWWGDYVDAHSTDHYHAFWSLRQYNPLYPQTTIHLMHIASGN